jgi:hypothetical protein
MLCFPGICLALSNILYLKADHTHVMFSWNMFSSKQYILFER